MMSLSTGSVAGGPKQPLLSQVYNAPGVGRNAPPFSVPADGRAVRYRVWKAIRTARGTGRSDRTRLLFAVNSPAEACRVIRRIQQREEQDPTALPSEYGLEVLSAGRWIEWHDVDGSDVTSRLPT